MLFEKVGYCGTLVPITILKSLDLLLEVAFYMYPIVFACWPGDCQHMIEEHLLVHELIRVMWLSGYVSIAFLIKKSSIQANVGPRVATGLECADVILPRIRTFNPSAACVSLFFNLVIRVTPNSRGQIRI
jgi:hypothetical protein